MDLLLYTEILYDFYVQNWLNLDKSHDHSIMIPCSTMVMVQSHALSGRKDQMMAYNIYSSVAMEILKTSKHITSQKGL